MIKKIVTVEDRVKCIKQTLSVLQSYLKSLDDFELLNVNTTVYKTFRK